MKDITDLHDAEGPEPLRASLERVTKPLVDQETQRLTDMMALRRFS